jgi:anti-sigma-K factor RskA
MAETVDIHALAGAYALDAVDDLERVAFDRHLRACASCTLEVAELKGTVAWLSHPVTEPAPPGLRAAVLAEVSRTPQKRPPRSSAGGSSTSITRWRRWTAAAVAASVLGLGIGAGTWAISEQRLKAERAANAQFQAVLSAPDARLIKAQMAGGEVSLVVSPSRDAAVAVFSGLSAPAPDHVYQLWMVGSPAEPGPVPVGTLDPGKGDGRAYIDGLRGAPTFAVSNEISGGASAPTNPVGHVDVG